LIGTLGFLCNLAFPDRRPSSLPRFITRTTLVLLAVVSLEEVAQAFIPVRSFDPVDWLADVIGLATGQALALTFLRTSTKKPLSQEGK
jgi:VanZ family protein